MELTEMLGELIDMLDDGEIEECLHADPALGDEWCDYCFVSNMKHVSLEEPAFTDETTPRQRESIARVWGRLCNDEEWSDFED